MKALVLAGGFAQIALINELQKRDIYVVLADYYEEPVAKKFADKFYQVSTLDMVAIEDVAKKEKVDFIITACTDQALLTVAYVSEKLGLPCYIDYKTALNVTNKTYMKSVFFNNKISTANFCVIDELKPDAVENMKYPMIVKPADCNSSKGVTKVRDYDELVNAYKNAKELSRTGTAVVEEYIEGKELSVDIYVENGVAHILAVSESEKIAGNEKFIIFRGKYPVNENQNIMRKIQKTAQQIADAFALKDCPMLMQVISDGKDIYVLEFSARTGGGVKYILIKKASGFDVIKAVVELTLGNKPHIEKLECEAEYFLNEFIYCKPGVFSHLEGFEELKKSGMMEDFYLFKSKGAVISSICSSGDRIAGFTVCAANKKELKDKYDAIVSRIKVIGDDGTDIMRHDITREI